MLKLNVLYNAVYLSRSIRPNKYPKIEFEIESKVRHSLLYIPLPFERQIQTSLRTCLCAAAKCTYYSELIENRFVTVPHLVNQIINPKPNNLPVLYDEAFYLF